jgi:hypothetical protein
MKRIITTAVALVVAVLLYSGLAAAESAEVSISRLLPAEDGMVYLSVSPELPFACKTPAGDNLRFNLKIDGGKAMYGLLLSAKLTNKKVAVWYTALEPKLVGKECGVPVTLTSVALN